MRQFDEEFERYVSVDVETSGPVPSKYSLLSIGACLVADPQCSFYVELRPLTMDAQPEALDVSQLSLERLAQEGMTPEEALQQFESWLADAVPAPKTPILVAFNAVFDWMFVADYFHRYLGRNPFGHSALDIKALYMGLSGKPWSQTSMRYVSARYLDNRHLSHNALRDAIDQAELFCGILAERRRQDEL